MRLVHVANIPPIQKQSKKEKLLEAAYLLASKQRYSRGDLRKAAIILDLALNTKSQE